MSQPEIAKNSRKTNILVFHDRSRLSLLVPQKRSLAILLYDKQQVCGYLQPFSYTS